MNGRKARQRRMEGAKALKKYNRRHRIWLLNEPPKWRFIKHRKWLKREPQLEQTHLFFCHK